MMSDDGDDMAFDEQESMPQLQYRHSPEPTIHAAVRGPPTVPAHSRVSIHEFEKYGMLTGPWHPV